MRSNSGKDESRNNNQDPTLRDHEAARGKSGEAITGARKVQSEPSRQGSREEQRKG